jgi:DNA-directed RNA polymerase specialized sigma24 family protein
MKHKQEDLQCTSIYTRSRLYTGDLLVRSHVHRKGVARFQPEANMTLHDDSYELFRRAVVEGDEQAWSTIALRYRNLMIAWATRCSAAHATGEPCEHLADQAFTRAWMALSAEQFAAFPNLAAILAYLRRCVTTTVIDAARSRACYDRAFGDGAMEGSAIVSAEQYVLERIERVEFWRLINSLTRTEEERVVLYERFVLDLAPRTILKRHSALFQDIAAVYAAIRNLCDRLRRHKQLAQRYAAYSSF